MGHAAKLVPFRVNFVFMASVILIGILVPSDDDRLLGGSGVTASPFIIAVNDAGISGIPDILNAGMITGILAIAAEGVYLSSRVLRTMAHQKLIPEVLAKVDSKGRPRWALAITIATCILLTYLNITRTLSLISKFFSFSSILESLLTLHVPSWWYYRIQLVSFNHQCLLLCQLDDHLPYFLEISPGISCPE